MTPEKRAGAGDRFHIRPLGVANNGPTGRRYAGRVSVRWLLWSIVAAAVALAGAPHRAAGGCNPNLAWQDRYPSWSGSLIAFQRQEVGCGGPETVAVFDVRTGSVRRLLRDSTFPSVSARGLVAAAHNETVVVADLREGLDELVGGTAPSWSPDGDRLAFLRDGGLWTVRADGTGERRLADVAVFSPFSQAHVTTPSWSPDGREIAFVGPGLKISVARADGSGVRRLTSGLDRQVSPVWSPDGARIAFASDRAENFDIWSIAPDGSGTARLTTDPADETLPAWASDGARVAFLRAVAGELGKAELWLAGRDGGYERLLGGDAHGFSQPAWSTDGGRIVFSSGRECKRWGLYVVDLDTGRQERLTNRCRFVGTQRDDTLAGSPFLDYLFGLRGDDRLKGFAGRDRLDGASGEDTLLGGSEGDTLFGGPDDDVIVAGLGVDVVVGGPGRDSISTGRNRDTVFARDGWRDSISCGVGEDTVRADRLDVVAADCEAVERR